VYQQIDIFSDKAETYVMHIHRVERRKQVKKLRKKTRKPWGQRLGQGGPDPSA
jgi:hypothetical protein